MPPAGRPTNCEPSAAGRSWKGGARERADDVFFCHRHKKTPEQSELCSGVVRLTGVEPVRPSGHKHLKLASLPIPAQPQTNDFENRSVIVHSEGEFVNGFFQNCCLSQCCSQILTDLNVLWVYSVLQQDLCNLIV